MNPESMAAAYIPFTFPTVTVQEWAGKAGNILSRAEVDRMWEAYKEATVKDGIPIFRDPRGGGNTPIVKAVAAKSGLTIVKAAAFLNATYSAVNEGGEGWCWIDPPRCEAAESGAIQSVTGGIGGAVSNILKPSLDPVTNLVKWGAVLVVGGAVVYGLYNFGWIFKKGRKRRKG